MTRLPGILAEIAQVAGEDAALRLARNRGGTQIYLPPIPAADHWICALIGRDAALAVCDRLTGGVGPRRVLVPLGPTGTQARARASVDNLLRDGNLSVRDIALATGYTDRGVWLRKAALDRRQFSLFSDA